MGKRNKRPPYLMPIPTFTPATDKPLRYFLTKDTFVRKGESGNYKLYCGEYMVLMLARDGFIYLYPSYEKKHHQYVEAFIHDYAPHIPFNTLEPYLGRLHAFYFQDNKIAFKL